MKRQTCFRRFAFISFLSSYHYFKEHLHAGVSTYTKKVLEKRPFLRYQVHIEGEHREYAKNSFSFFISL